MPAGFGPISRVFCFKRAFTPKQVCGSFCSVKWETFGAKKKRKGRVKREKGNKGAGAVLEVPSWGFPGRREPALKSHSWAELIGAPWSCGRLCLVQSCHSCTASDLELKKRQIWRTCDKIPQLNVGSHQGMRITEWFGLEGAVNITQFHPHWHRLGWHPLDHVSHPEL